MLRHQSSKLPQDQSVITAQTTNSSPALPTPSEHSKRTLSGEEAISPTKVEKRQLMSKNGTDLPTSPTCQQLRESRTPSIQQATLAQLSSELRTRLSYAIVKVKNRWQSKTIDEVESLASRKGSLASSTSTRLNLLASLPWPPKPSG